VAGLFYGIKPAVTAIVVQAAHRIGGRALKNNALWAIAAASFVAIFALDIPFPAIVAAAARVRSPSPAWQAVRSSLSALLISTCSLMNRPISVIASQPQ